ncbi:ETC complex I subunit region [Salipiger pallidus]|uniref:ETC complex I subunit region n=1 Tax=Salipiger pallidus TaxID=1775170 RepID=A0A8J3EGG6_9RHOB|nr:ETC complex I subunit [Salipiger pallidus]GGG73084.1 ETC complex I subunit region [Salipiger pallidus]
MRARIYQPAKTAMSSGQGKTKHWVLDFVHETAREVDPLMGWTSSDDTQSQVRLRFDSKEAALDYAKEHGIDAIVTSPNKRRANVRPRGYAENFAVDRRSVWTH